MPDNKQGKWRIRVHYTIGKTVNIDDYTCAEYASDVGSGVIRLTKGKDHEGAPVRIVQYHKPWRILITNEEEND